MVLLASGVDGPEVSARQLEDRVDGLRVEGEVVGAGDLDAMLHVVECFGAREKAQRCEVSHASSYRLELWSVEEKA